MSHFILQSVNSIYSFILNQAMFLFIIEVIAIIVFSINMLNPNSIVKANNQILNENKFDSNGQGSLEVFLSNYNSIEKKIMSMSEEFYKNITYKEWDKIKSNKNFRPGLLTALKILNSMDILNKNQVTELDEIRIYRNSVVHSDIPKVSKEAELRIVELNQEIEKIFY